MGNANNDAFDSKLFLAHDACSFQAENAELTSFQAHPFPLALKPTPGARIEPLYEAPPEVVRAVLGDLSDSQLAQYREVCKYHATHPKCDNKACKSPQCQPVEVDANFVSRE